MSITCGGSHLVMDVARYFRIYLLSCIAILGQDIGKDKDTADPRISRGKGVNKPWALAGELHCNTCISFLNAIHQ
jgi:hypothetical protein